MPKEINEEPKVHTKKHLARLEKEHRQKKVLLISLIAILGVILLLVVYGLLNDTVLKPKKLVAKVNNARSRLSNSRNGLNMNVSHSHKLSFNMHFLIGHISSNHNCLVFKINWTITSNLAVTHWIP